MASQDNSSRPSTTWGAGSLHELDAIRDALGVRRVMAVAGSSVDAIVTRLPELLGSRYLGRWSDVPAHVPAYQANVAVASAQETHADAVLGVGGGSAIGLAKIVALALRLPLIAVPTTYSGTEMTSRYYVTTERGKEGGTSDRVLPKAVCYDPLLTAELPQHVIASSGMLAVAHCVQTLCRPAVTSEAADRAREGLLLLWDSLGKLAAGARDNDCLQDALAGASLAGQAIELAGPGPQHLLCDLASTRFGVEFGALHATVLPIVLGGYGDEAASARAAIHELRPDASAEQALADLRASLGIPDIQAPLGAVLREIPTNSDAQYHIDYPVITRLRNLITD